MAAGKVAAAIHRATLTSKLGQLIEADCYVSSLSGDEDGAAFTITVGETVYLVTIAPGHEGATLH